MDKNMPIAFFTRILGRIYDILGALLGKKGSPGSNTPPTDGTGNQSTNASGGTGNQSVNASGGSVGVNQNITFNFNFINYEEVSKRFSCGTEKLLLAKDKETGAELVMEWQQGKPGDLAIGFYAYCSFGDKKDLPVWAGFQPKDPSKDNTLDNLTFSVELLGRRTWLNAGMEHAKLEACGYKGKGEEYPYEASYYKWVDGIKLDTDTEVLREAFEKELKGIEEMLSVNQDPGCGESVDREEERKMDDFGTFMKYSNTYVNDEIDVKVFSLISIITILSFQQQSKLISPNILVTLEKLFSKKSLTPKEEQAIKNELRKLYAQNLPLDSRLVADALDEIDRILG
jgi:hypothetical protein